VCAYGVCLVDAATASVTLGQFSDDKLRSRLRTLLAVHKPAEVLLETQRHSNDTRSVVNFAAPNARVEMLAAGTEFWDRDKAVVELKRGRYFGAASKRADAAPADASTDGTSRWPALVQAVIGGGPDSALCVSALGGLCFYLRRNLVDHQLLSMQRFAPYVPPDDDVPANGDQGATPKARSKLAALAAAQAPSPTDGAGAAAAAAAAAAAPAALPYDLRVPEFGTPAWSGVGHMVLDGITLANLEVLDTAADGVGCSLLKHMDHTKTPFGKRLLRDWLTRPLLRPADIDERLSAVSELAGACAPEGQAAAKKMAKLPDLERLLQQVHSLGSAHRSEDHPDGRAVMMEPIKYNRNKLSRFTKLMGGLREALSVLHCFADPGEGPLASSLLSKVAGAEDRGGLFPAAAMNRRLADLDRLFDTKEATKSNKIVARPGALPAYDEAQAEMAAIDADLQGMLKEIQREHGAGVKFRHKGKDRYLLQVPEALHKQMRVPSDWVPKGKTKAARDFSLRTIQVKVAQWELALERRDGAERDQQRVIFEKFSEGHADWAKAIRCLSVLDALLSLAEVAHLPGYCRPTFLDAAANPTTRLELQGSRHPCLKSVYGGGDLIDNNVALGGKAQPLMLLTGPNMGGKSTLLRQTCLVAVMAQVGSFVPCTQCALTPIDRIFTRIGASDNILQGQSTFFVELSETATILRASTPRSLVILDELGRGTSTFDGTGIAHAVVKRLVETTGCASMFATHYHSLVDDWKDDPRVALGHMQCYVAETDEAGDAVGDITFLYKLGQGSAPRSFGLNVARLAQLPEEVLRLAKAKSLEFEASMEVDAGSGKEEREVVDKMRACLAGPDAGAALRTLWEGLRK